MLLIGWVPGWNPTESWARGGTSRQRVRYNRFHGLTILINDTEETTIWYMGNFNLNNDTKVWFADFYFEVTDHFGLDKHDAIEYQGYHTGFAAWWTLQHKRNYPPFRTKITIFATLKGQL
jgi:hypothetical protein